MRARISMWGLRAEKGHTAGMFSEAKGVDDESRCRRGAVCWPDVLSR